jgi:hypothetical protein
MSPLSDRKDSPEEIDTDPDIDVDVMPLLTEMLPLTALLVSVLMLQIRTDPLA